MELFSDPGESINVDNDHIHSRESFLLHCEKASLRHMPQGVQLCIIITGRADVPEPTGNCLDTDRYSEGYLHT